MEFRDVKPNNRLQLEVESEDSSLRNIRGIVLALGDASIILVTDYGELVEIFKDNVLSISGISMPKPVSDVMTDLKNHYAEIYELESKLKDLRDQEPLLKQSLFDANFLARFNITGAKNRLDKSIEPNLMSFCKNDLCYRIYFEANPNSQIEVIVHVANHIDYPNLDEIRDVDKILRVHAPDSSDFIQKCFSFGSKPQELEKKIVHEKESLYSIRTIHKVNIDVSKENFLEMRDRIKRALIKLQNS